MAGLLGFDKMMQVSLPANVYKVAPKHDDLLVAGTNSRATWCGRQGVATNLLNTCFLESV